MDDGRVRARDGGPPPLKKESSTGGAKGGVMLNLEPEERDTLHSQTPTAGHIL